jgi:hypothetical protein
MAQSRQTKCHELKNGDRGPLIQGAWARKEWPRLASVSMNGMRLFSHPAHLLRY